MIPPVTTTGTKRGLGSVLRDAWRLTAPYFMRSDERWSARLLLGAIIVMSLVTVALTVVLNYWHGAFYNALQEKDFTAFTQLILTWQVTPDGFIPGFVPIVVVLVPLGFYSTYLTQLLQLRWRRHMTEQMVGGWLEDRAYYTISLENVAAAPGQARATDNPDQRISEDLNNFTNDTLTLSLDLLSNIVSLVSFSQILWVLSGTVAVLGIPIPGYMFWLCLVYAVAGSWVTHLVGRPLALLNFLRQKVEADFRFALVRVRENAEGIALYAGEQPERAGLMSRFAEVFLNYRAVMTRQKKLNALTGIYAQAAVLFPFAVAAPRFFSGAIELGGLMRVVGAFAQVQVAMSWFVTNYASLATWRATVDRLTTFQSALETAHALAGAGVRLRQNAAAPGITLQNVTMDLPGGRTLLHGGIITLPKGRATVISGRSGIGKSTLFRALAGIWPFGSGTVERPSGSALFLPQRPYIPLGTLREAVTYPAAPGTIPDAAIRDALAATGLGALLPELDTDQPWAQRLSGGEQQRLAFARALLLHPDWLFLDEATASLDPHAEAELYRTIREKLPATTVLSIAHRAEVARWHDQSLIFTEGGLHEAEPVPAK